VPFGCLSEMPAAVEDRKLIAWAATSLAPFAVPDDFTDRVMARIARRRSNPRLAHNSGLRLLTAGPGSVILIASGSDVIEIALRASHSVWEYAKGAALFTVKAVTLLSLAGKTIRLLLEAVIKGLSLANSFVSPGFSSGSWL